MVLLVALGALTVVLLVGALLFPARPHEFLSGTDVVWTTVTQSPPYKDICETQYVSDLSVREVCDLVADELVPQGWERIQNSFYTPGDNAERIMVCEGSDDVMGMGPRGKTVITIERIATSLDRFTIWLDNRLGR